VAPGDISGLARNMGAVLGSSALAGNLGAAARARVQAQWSIEATVDAYENVYLLAMDDHANATVGEIGMLSPGGGRHAR
jgi:hypothetical protein